MDLWEETVGKDRQMTVCMVMVVTFNCDTDTYDYGTGWKCNSLCMIIV